MNLDKRKERLVQMIHREIDRDETMQHIAKDSYIQITDHAYTRARQRGLRESTFKSVLTSSRFYKKNEDDKKIVTIVNADGFGFVVEKNGGDEFSVFQVFTVITVISPEMVERNIEESPIQRMNPLRK